MLEPQFQYAPPTIMAAIIDICQSIIDEENVDKRVQGWPLVSDNWKIVAITLTYLSLVYVVLPLYMKDRRPYNLQGVIKAYNVIQIVSCAVLVYGVATSGWTTHYSLRCSPVDSSATPMNMRMANYVWWHVIIKIFDLVETPMYVIRKKYNQVTFLHVYHHIFSVFISWYMCKFVPGGMITINIVVNSSIHIVMYMYYLLASFGPSMQEKLKYIKPKLTTLQIAQLIFLVLHSLQGLLSCQLSKMEKIIYYIHIPAVSFLILLFFNFYAKAFLKKAKKV